MVDVRICHQIRLSLCFTELTRLNVSQVTIASVLFRSFTPREVSTYEGFACALRRPTTPAIWH
ncbi:hypothetical protein U2A404210156 [Corynebacterium striatum]|nr:hypothetical protein U2A404210156 [Corynebacterium striatum]